MCLALSFFADDVCFSYLPVLKEEHHAGVPEPFELRPGPVPSEGDRENDRLVEHQNALLHFPQEAQSLCDRAINAGPGGFGRAARPRFENVCPVREEGDDKIRTD